LQRCQPLLTVFVLIFAAFTSLKAQQDIMPLSEIEPGMVGEWRTVVSGTEVQSYQLKVLGVLDNFVGPGFPIILCEATDEEQIENGPVGGMSGSPVYINGRMIGAYAYGFTWPKRQTLIGVTPIEQMLKVLEMPTEVPDAITQVPSGKATPDATTTPQLSAPIAASGTSAGELRSLLKPLPTPLTVSGISSQTLDAFQDEFRELGLEVSQAPMGSSRASLSADDLEPGSAIAGVLMDGDFNFAATGTLTWREDDKLLGFGHPFLQDGATEMPLAGAEIVTIVRSLARSFKLSNVGEPVGSIYQDRLPAIAGEIGRQAFTTPFTMRVQREGLPEQTYSGNLFQHRRLTPLIAALATMESLRSTTEFNDRSTYDVNLRLEVEGEAPLEYARTWTGQTALTDPAITLMNLYGTLLNSVFEPARVTQMDLEATVRNGWQMTFLQSLQQTSGKPRAGEAFSALVTLRDYQDETQTLRINVPIPADAAGEELRLVIADAVIADTYTRGDSRSDLRSLGDLITYLSNPRPTQAVYVLLLREAPALRVEGQDLMDLPPSVSHILSHPKSQIPMNSPRFVPIHEEAIPLETVFSGSRTLTLKIDP